MGKAGRLQQQRAKHLNDPTRQVRKSFAWAGLDSYVPAALREARAASELEQILAADPALYDELEAGCKYVDSHEGPLAMREVLKRHGIDPDFLGKAREERHQSG